MNDLELQALFDQQAPGYDQQWAKNAPIRDSLHYLLESVFAGLPQNARLLCVGAGTGAELLHLARRFPGWRFTALDPSAAMIDVCRQKAEAEGIAGRCAFHQGYVDDLPVEEAYDAATCFLVSQFMLQAAARADFFRSIARRLKPGGLLASSDLARPEASADYEALLAVWFNMMSAAELSAEAIERMREAYARDVAVLPPAEVAAILRAGGFAHPVPFFQAGLIHAWFSRRG